MRSGEAGGVAAPGLADRVGRAGVAATVQMAERARVLQAAGKPVISLALGEPDFASPPHAVAAAYAAAQAGDTKYPPQDGTPALKRAVRSVFQRERGLVFGADEVLVCNGGKQALFNAFMATLNDGDEVIIPAPYWAAYPLTARVAGGVPVVVACPQNNQFRLRPEDLEAAITPRTKWLVLNAPNNPTGSAYSETELRALAEVITRHSQVWVLSDEMYAHLVYEGAFISFAAAAPHLRDRILTVYGVSKTYAMTGWRIGFAAGPARLIRAMTVMQGHGTAGVSTIGQAAAVAALEGPQEAVAWQVAQYRARRDRLVASLNAAPGVQCARPDGAFYVYPSLAGCLGRTSAGGQPIDSDAAFCGALLEEQHVATVPGDAFGLSPYMRLSYATGDAELAEAADRIRLFCERLH